ncbi:phospholipase B1, membrane-associated-like [Alosa sapidissima]|uniref:phospholipase B1, membrane-associated-like n=1 Tax=Alosa sapidissima TaxID=34773 RepID=UPI001C0A6630|nr:phospholipase B1, membrane-associated-like [Alosa sapidissima]
MVEFLYHQQDDWKLVLLFVQMDSVCVCPEQIDETVQQVEKTLEFLSSQLKKAIVNVIVWDSSAKPAYFPQSRVCPCDEARTAGELRLMRAVLPQLLQETLQRHLVDKTFYSDKDDFTVVLQNAPMSADLPGSASGRYTVDESLNMNKLAVQLWANLLQPNDEQQNVDGKSFRIPCPSEERPYLRTERNSPSETYVTTTAPVIDPVMGTELPCMDRSPSPVPPTSVHEVRPADIKVVAAIGDSLTAGNGLGASPNNLLQVLVQYRGLSWCVGGDKNLSHVSTLPNILKEFNANVTGFSEDSGRQDTPQAFLNQAVAGAKAADILGQARALVERMKTDSRVDFQNDWKVITVFIGGNDMCDYCKNALQFSPETFARHVRETLDFLKQEVPRAIVNLVEPLHIVPLRRMHQDKSLNCPTWLVNILCPCVISPAEGSEAERRLAELNRAYQQVLHELTESGRYDTHDNFTVVIQPFMRTIILPLLPDGRADRSYFTPDCFHLSQKAHTQMARALWNNMLEPLGNKTHTQEFTNSIEMKCPSQSSPFVRTYKNSNYTYQGPTLPPPEITNWGRDFSCKDVSPSATVPTSVHKLRPGDIKVVCALGDSITTGRAAKANSYNTLKTDYKGVSWSIGGDNTLMTTTTLPNILKNFNPTIKGFSRGQGLLATKGFNMAVSGAQAFDIPAQVRSLLRAMNSSKDVNFAEDWKLVTLLVGVSDLCHYCTDQNNLSPKNFTKHVMDSLDLLYATVPRLLVNLVEVPQVDLLKKINKGSLTCNFLPSELCPCVVNPTENSPELMELKRVNKKYQAALQQLLSEGRYDDREDFAVVLQPFLQHSAVPLIGEGQTDLSYFSLDCVHLSEKAQSEMATALWNNMLEPVGRKQFYTNLTYDRTKVHCPTEAQPFIFTRQNSQLGPAPATTSAPSETTTMQFTPAPVSSCPASVPVWVPVVLAITGLLIGWAVTWMVFSRKQKRMLKSMKKEGKDTAKKETGL